MAKQAGGLDGAPDRDFLLGLPNAYGVSIAPPAYAQPWSLQIFAHDNYKVSSKLTVNPSLRYQYEPMWTEARGHLSNFDPNAINPVVSTPGAIVYPTAANRF